MAQNGRLSVSVNAEKGKQLFCINNHFVVLLSKCIFTVCIVLQHALFCFRTKTHFVFIKENTGELTFTLKKTAALTPYAQVVVYTVLPNGEAVADSMDFPIEECLPNKVRKSHMKSHFRTQCFYH